MRAANKLFVWPLRYSRRDRRVVAADAAVINKTNAAFVALSLVHGT